MDVQFHPYWSVAITLGLVNFFIFSVILILILIKGRDESFKENNLMFMSFYIYFDEVEVKVIIIKHILNFILNFFLN